VRLPRAMPRSTFAFRQRRCRSPARPATSRALPTAGTECIGASARCAGRICSAKRRLDRTSSSFVRAHWTTARSPALPRRSGPAKLRRGPVPTRACRLSWGKLRRLHRSVYRYRTPSCQCPSLGRDEVGIGLGPTAPVLSARLVARKAPRAAWESGSREEPRVYRTRACQMESQAPRCLT
jgi:hypothetical protein